MLDESKAIDKLKYEDENCRRIHNIKPKKN